MGKQRISSRWIERTKNGVFALSFSHLQYSPYSIVRYLLSFALPEICISQFFFLRLVFVLFGRHATIGRRSTRTAIVYDSERKAHIGPGGELR